MRAGLVVVVAACGGALGPPPAPPPDRAPPAVQARPAIIERAHLDPIAALTPSEGAAEGAEVSWLAPGGVQLEVGATMIEGPGVVPPLEVAIIDEYGNLVRVAVRLGHARFSVWTERARLFALLRQDQRLGAGAHGATPGDPEVLLRAGAKVTRLARKKQWTKVRYLGAVELEGWVLEAALGDRAPRGPGSRSMFPRRRTMVTRGSVIRGEPRWSARELAVVATTYFVESLRELDGDWMQVRYADRDVAVTGYLSKRAPPGRLHQRAADPQLAPVPTTPNVKVASGTCLYARVDGDPVGYLVGDHEVELAEAGSRWWHLALETPWGAIVFAARGPSAADLSACAPDGAAPLSTLPGAQGAP